MVASLEKGKAASLIEGQRVHSHQALAAAALVPDLYSWCLRTHE